MGDEWQHRWRWGMAKMRIVVILVELKTIRMVSWVGSAGVAADSRYKEWQCVGVQETMGHDGVLACPIKGVIWDTLVVTLSNSAPDGKLTTDTVSDSLMTEEARRKERDLPSQSEANVVENQGRSNNRIKSEN
ncbi:hypothetical protein V6N13_088820 [Hibiscus sabdariffa]